MFIISSLCFLFALAATLTLCSSPTVLGLWIIFTALLIATIVACSSISWLGLIIFLIYVGGLLVIFAYFVALTPNIIIESALWMLTLITISFTLLFIFFLFTSLLDTKTFSISSNFPIINFFIVNSFAILCLVVVLFIALVSVVKVCASTSAPLRPFN